ncbi:RNA polymerase sigma factor [Nocardioides ferulae]|uniref:RNA polymerase sigma factor n=1 Tax=Nocardioides ferulae TaxID=2340821 RepID=UPI001980CE51|nr:sigma-70 family RNA polymerase sigma factor [Nocardioides ferulae]
MSNELDDGGRTPAHRAAFTACWQRDAGRVHAYAVRHVGPDDAAEVVSEAFLAAWRRWPQVPDPPLPWLIGAARKAAANHRRGRDRRRALQQRLELASADGAEVDTVPEETRRTAPDSDHEGPPILFGFAGGDFDLPDGTAAVGVAGPGVDETIPVTEPEGWAVELPAPAATERYVVRFLDADGRTLHQVTERVDP